MLPLLRGHFCSRLPDDDFLIFDAAHGTALVRRSGRVQYLTMERYTPGTDAGELDWQRLWKRFFKALTIEERRNEKAQMNHVQKRFWKDMVEMQGDLPSPWSEALFVVILRVGGLIFRSASAEALGVCAAHAAGVGQRPHHARMSPAVERLADGPELTAPQ